MMHSLTSSSEPYLASAAFSDYDYLLSRIGDLQVRPEVRRYYQFIYAIQLAHRLKWLAFSLLLTTAIEFEIHAFFPDSYHTGALVALFLAFLIMFVVYACTQCMWLVAGDPAEVFQTHDEETGLIQKATAAAAASHPVPGVNTVQTNSNLGTLFTVSLDSPATTTDDERAETVSPSVPNASAAAATAVLSNNKNNNHSRLGANSTLRAGLVFAQPSMHRSYQKAREKHG